MSTPFSFESVFYTKFPKLEVQCRSWKLL